MKTVLKSCFALILLIACQFALADTAGGGNFDSNHFGIALASNDQSVYYLGLLFGQVGSVLNGTGSQVLGIMFGEFNHAILILGIIVFTYVYGKGIVDTAAHGEFLGKQNNSIWIPIRSVLGIALMIPKAATGYAVIQIFMMWIVIQGVGAADMIWDKTVDYMKGPVGGNPDTTSLDKITEVSTVNNIKTATQTVFLNMTCLAWARAYDQDRGQTNIAYHKELDSSFVSNPDSSATYAGYTFSYTFASPYDSPATVACGSAYWQTNDNECATTQNQPQSGACLARLNAQQQAVQNIINTYKPIGAYYVDSVLPSMIKKQTSQVVPHNKGLIAPVLNGENNFPTNTNSDFGENIYNYAGSNFMIAATRMYLAQLKLTDIQNQTDQNAGQNNDITDKGWLYAGSYYYQLVSGNAKKAGNIPAFAAKKGVIDSDTFGTSWGDPNLTPLSNANNYAENVVSLPSSPNSNPQGDTDNATKLAKAFGSYGAIIEVGLVAGTVGLALAQQYAMAFLTAGVTVSLGAILVAMEMVISNTASISLPITALSVAGQVILATVVVAWLAAIVITFVTGLGENIMSCMQPVGWASKDASTYVSGAFYAILGSLLAVGAFLAVYLPLMPFIYFFFAVMNWFIAVIETMVAAPLVALGIIHPEGHDLWGKAEPAVMLTVNVFLRPALILFGFIAGMLLSYILIQILTNGFALAIGEGFNSWAVLVNPVAFFFYVVFYLGVLFIIIQQSFKLTIDIPNRVLQWLGFQGQLGGNMDEATQQTKQQHQQGAQESQQGFKGSENAARESARMKKQADKEGAEASGKSGTAGSSSKGTSDAEKAAAMQAAAAKRPGGTP